MTIDKNIPMPPSQKVRVGKHYFLTTMAVGDSFFVPEPASHKAYYEWHGAARHYHIKVAVRKVEGGVRVWRVA